MRILVAMSGGVDSSVVAGLLHEAGHEVIGVTLQLYDHGAATGRKGACCAGQDIHDARRVADHLGIPHYVIDAEQRFADAVIGDFADSYAAGETPVPCVRCNQTVKFADLTALAQGLGCERLATGHYVRRIDGADGPELHRATDLARDQSWFLFATTREQLARVLFPLGEMDKRRVRSEAERLGLPVAAKPDSQDICFVPSGSYADVVTRLRPDAGEAGEIVDRLGHVRGRHDGIARYTVGQGKRLGHAAINAGERQVVVAAGAGAPAGRDWPASCRNGSGALARGELAGIVAGVPTALFGEAAGTGSAARCLGERHGGRCGGPPGCSRAAGARTGLRVLRGGACAWRRLHPARGRRSGG